jgi:UDP-MurNAc hydroxylase
MRLTFVNHASFIIEYKATKLICDPWMEGTAFDNGWALLSKTQLRYEDFKDITHIWFSHEHPDHFSPSNISKIPRDYRKKITVLFQETADRKVLEFCKKMEFKEIIELKTNTFHTIDTDFEILCNAYTFDDSYALFKTKNHTLLNLNDCVINTDQAAAQLAKQVGTVDVLFTQFGYAKKIGNTTDTAERIASSKEKLQRIGYQSAYLKPKYIVPFASYIYFCHVDNAYMNDGIFKVDSVSTFIEKELGVKSVVLYPNDSWNIGEDWNSQPSIQRYLQDYADIPNRPLLASSKIDLSELKDQSQKFIGELVKGYPKSKKRVEATEMKIFLTDYNRFFTLSGKTGLIESEITGDAFDIALNSDSLNYMFKFLWGGQTLGVNAKFQISPNGNSKNAYFFIELAGHLNNKTSYDKVFPILTTRIIRKIKRVLTLN